MPLSESAGIFVSMILRCSKEWLEHSVRMISKRRIHSVLYQTARRCGRRGAPGAALVAGPAAAQAQSAAAIQIPCRASALVSAISNANSGSGGIIVLPANCSYDITAAAAPGDGLPVITGHVVLSGAHNTAIRRRAGTTFRLFDVAGGGSLSLTSITGDGGNTAGLGGIQNAGTVVLSRAVFTNNTAGNGGALANNAGGTVRVSDSDFERNTATSVGGGAIINSGDLTVTGSVLSHNTAPINGGAVNTQSAGTTRLTNATVSENTSGGPGRRAVPTSARPS